MPDKKKKKKNLQVPTLFHSAYIYVSLSLSELLYVCLTIKDMVYMCILLADNIIYPSVGMFIRYDSYGCLLSTAKGVQKVELTHLASFEIKVDPNDISFQFKQLGKKMYRQIHFVSSKT